jgi:hypothetical protein
MRRIIAPLGSDAAGGADAFAGIPPGLSDMISPSLAGGILKTPDVVLLREANSAVK